MRGVQSFRHRSAEIADSVVRQSRGSVSEPLGAKCVLLRELLWQWSTNDKPALRGYL